jgi:hypothetical protein
MGPALRSLPLRRVAAFVVLLVVAALYVAPVQKYLRVHRELSRQRAALSEAQRRNAALTRADQALGTDVRIITLARECGWIFPGERPLVVEGLPGGDQTHCS